MFGVNILLGKRFSSTNMFNAYAIFLDNCGNVVSSTLIDIPNSFQEEFRTFVVLPNQSMLLIGAASINGVSVGLLSTYNFDGTYISSSALCWAVDVTVTAALLIPGDRRVYAGFSGIGFNYRDIMLSLFDTDNDLIWSKKYGTNVREEARSIAWCSAGIVIVGVHGNINFNGFILIVDLKGRILKECFLDKAELNMAKSIVGGGFVVVGKVTRGSRSAALLIIADELGNSLKKFVFEHETDNFALSASSLEIMKNGNFAVLLDLSFVIKGSSSSVLVIMEFNSTACKIMKTRYIGSSQSLRTFGRSIFKSPQGGYNVAFNEKPAFKSYAFAFGEVTDELQFPGYIEDEALSRLSIYAIDVTSSTLVLNISFSVTGLVGFHKQPFAAEVLRAEHITKQQFFGQGACTAVNVSPVPTTSPVSAPATQRPTDVPSIEPSKSPTIDPTTKWPTATPTTFSPTEQNATNFPTHAPTSKPSISPTAVPTSHPTEEPTVCPTQSPTAPPAAPGPSAILTPVPSRVPTLHHSGWPSSLPSTLRPTQDPTALGGDGETDSSTVVSDASEETILVTLGYVVGTLVVIGAIATYRKSRSKCYIQWGKLDTSILQNSDAKPKALTSDIENGLQASEARFAEPVTLPINKVNLENKVFRDADTGESRIAADSATVNISRNMTISHGELTDKTKSDEIFNWSSSSAGSTKNHSVSLGSCNRNCSDTNKSVATGSIEDRAFSNKDQNFGLCLQESKRDGEWWNLSSAESSVHAESSDSDFSN